MIGFIAAGLILLVAGVAYVRLAPVDAARWHVPPPTHALANDAACTDTITAAANSAAAHCAPSGSAAEALARLDAIALATPRTRQIAGSVTEGMITWETRSRLWGFPDYTTARATDAKGRGRLDILARSRFGGSDWGVNAARLHDWLARL